MAEKTAYMTVTEAVETVKEITPTLKTISKHYTKASPLIDWSIDYWPIVVASTFLGIVTGSAVGTLIVQYSRKRR